MSKTDEAISSAARLARKMDEHLTKISKNEPPFEVGMAIAILIATILSGIAEEASMPLNEVEEAFFEAVRVAGGSKDAKAIH